MLFVVIHRKICHSLSFLSRFCMHIKNSICTHILFYINNLHTSLCFYRYIKRTLKEKSLKCLPLSLPLFPQYFSELAQLLRIDLDKTCCSNFIDYYHHKNKLNRKKDVKNHLFKATNIHHYYLHE